MGKRGHELNLASGVMFSPQQEDKKMQRARIKLVNDLIASHMASKGIRVEHFKRPSLVHEYHFYMADQRVARRSLEDVDIRKGARSAACNVMESVCKDLGIPFSWDDVPERPEPEPTRRVDNVGGPVETSGRVRPTPDPVPVPEMVEEPAEEAEDTSQDDADAFNENMTIAQLRSWGRAHGTVVPGEITRKGDILEYLANEHSD